MYKHVYIYDLGEAISIIYNSLDTSFTTIGIDDILLVYLHERHLFPLTPSLNARYTLFKNNLLHNAQVYFDNLYTVLDRTIKALQNQPIEHRRYFLSNFRLAGTQLYVFLS